MLLGEDKHLSSLQQAETLVGENQGKTFTCKTGISLALLPDLVQTVHTPTVIQRPTLTVCIKI